MKESNEMWIWMWMVEEEEKWNWNNKTIINIWPDFFFRLVGLSLSLLSFGVKIGVGFGLIIGEKYFKQRKPNPKK